MLVIKESFMIIFLTNSKDATCDYFCNVANSNSVRYMRLNTDFDSECVTVDFGVKRNISLTYYDAKVSPCDVTCIWNRRPEKIHAGNKGLSAFDEHYRDEWRHSLDGFFKQIHEDKWINHPYNNANAISKIEQIIRAKRYGLLVPDTIVTQDINTLNAFLKQKKGKVITKPLSHGYICDENSVHNIYTNEVIVEKCDFSSLPNCPTLFQERIEKVSDIRINYIDGIMEATELLFLEKGAQRLDIRKDNMDGVQYNNISLPYAIEKKLVRLVKSYKLRFAAIDMGITNTGKWIFFEINPNGQWAWLDILGVANFHEKLLAQMLK